MIRILTFTDFDDFFEFCILNLKNIFFQLLFDGIIFLILFQTTIYFKFFRNLKNDEMLDVNFSISLISLKVRKMLCLFNTL
jgi:hypothetical protein